MQYKVLQFEVTPESKSFWSLEIIPKEAKLSAMEEKINELANDGWRVNQMSTAPITADGGGLQAAYVIGYNVIVIMEKE